MTPFYLTSIRFLSGVFETVISVYSQFDSTAVIDLEVHLACILVAILALGLPVFCDDKSTSSCDIVRMSRLKVAQLSLVGFKIYSLAFGGHSAAAFAFLSSTATDHSPLVSPTIQCSSDWSEMVIRPVSPEKTVCEE